MLQGSFGLNQADFVLCGKAGIPHPCFTEKKQKATLQFLQGFMQNCSVPGNAHDLRKHKTFGKRITHRNAILYQSCFIFIDSYNSIEKTY